MAKAAKAQAAPSQQPVRAIIDDPDMPELPKRGCDPFPCGPQILDVPKCKHCGSMKVKAATTQGVRVSGRRWLRTKYRCDDSKCAGRTDLSVVMKPDKRGAPLVAGDTDQAAKVDLTVYRKPAAKPRGSITFASGT